MRPASGSGMGGPPGGGRFRAVFGPRSALRVLRAPGRLHRKEAVTSYRVTNYRCTGSPRFADRPTRPCFPRREPEEAPTDGSAQQESPPPGGTVSVGSSCGVGSADGSCALYSEVPRTSRHQRSSLSISSSGQPTSIATPEAAVRGSTALTVGRGAEAPASGRCTTPPYVHGNVFVVPGAVSCPIGVSSVTVSRCRITSYAYPSLAGPSGWYTPRSLGGADQQLPSTPGSLCHGSSHTGSSRPITGARGSVT